MRGSPAGATDHSDKVKFKDDTPKYQAQGFVG